MLFEQDCLSWLEQAEPCSVHAVVTDPPYGAREFEQDHEKLKLRSGGVWRQPPAIGGSLRSPVPRFTTLSADDELKMRAFFSSFAVALCRVLVPGAHVFVAASPLLSHLVFRPMMGAGLQWRGSIVRLVQTLRGGDRPKGAHEEFPEVTVMPRSGHEPWGLFRKPLDGTVAENLRRWGTGGLRRISGEQPFLDVIRSSPTPRSERRLCPHPSLKPQAFVRQLVRASLPLGTGVVLDPFMGGGSVIAAAERLGIRSIGIERDSEYFSMAASAIPALAQLSCGAEDAETG